jgi:hypothetical protein
MVEVKYSERPILHGLLHGSEGGLLHSHLHVHHSRLGLGDLGVEDSAESPRFSFQTDKEKDDQLQ